MNGTKLLWTSWFVGGLILTTATELRLPGSPLGPGELLLGLWAAATALVLLTRGRAGGSPVGRVTTLFWFTAFCLLLAGSLAASFLGISARGAGHDTLAFAFTAMVVTVYVARPEVETRTRFTVDLMVGVTVCLLAALFLYGKFVSRTLGPITLWYSHRFAGLSKNPNQLALLLCPVPFVATYLLRGARTLPRKAWYVVATLVTVYIGLATRSDALLVSWVASLALGVLLLWVASMRSVRRSLLRAGFAYVLFPLTVLSGVAIYGPAVVADLVEVGGTVYEQGNQGSFRIVLYTNGLRAIAASPLAGLGPGAHSGAEGPFGGSEAHNTFIDWGASTGSLGLAAYAWLMGWFAWQAWKRRQPVLFLAVFAALAYSSFHYVMRHPVFWFYLVSVAALARQHGAGAGAAPEPRRPGRGRARARALPALPPHPAAASVLAPHRPSGA